MIIPVIKIKMRLESKGNFVDFSMVDYIRFDILVFNFELIEIMVENKLNEQQNKVHIKNVSICDLFSSINTFASGMVFEK